jgi:hypothetical protein
VSEARPARQATADSRFGATAEGVVKVLGALTGVAAIVYALGVLVVARRLQAAGLPWRDTMAALPRDQVLASGTIELGYSLLGALMILLTGAAFVALAQIVAAWLPRRDPARVLLIGLIVFSLASLVAIPFNAVGLVCLGLLVGLTLWLYVVVRPFATRDELRSLGHDLTGAAGVSRWSQRPLGWMAVLLAAIAVVLSVGRIWSFPDEFEVATATIDEDTPVRDALYIGSGPQYVVLGERGSPGRITLVRSDGVQQLELHDGPSGGSFSRSLISRLGLIGLTSFYPTFRRDPVQRRATG